MANKQKPDVINEMLILPLVLSNGIIIRHAYTVNEKWWWLLIVTLPLLLWAFINDRERKGVTMRKPPVTRRLRHSFEPGEHKKLVRRREQSHYIRFKVFSRDR